MLDYDLAALYGVEARALNQAVKRNVARFPADFMFQLSANEAKRVSQTEIPLADENSKDRETNSSQFVMSSRKHRGKRYLPYAFTEQGVAICSSALRRDRSGERTRLACWRWRPRHRGLGLHRRILDPGPLIQRRFSASRRKVHASRVRSPR
ncbi:MAG: ORF6N domain-containing protein [Chthoniobacterales bacterium]